MLADADRVLAEALKAYPATERLDRSLIHFDRAMFRLIRGEVEEALRIGEATIKDLPADHRPEIVLNRARELVLLLTPRLAAAPRRRACVTRSPRFLRR